MKLEDVPQDRGMITDDSQEVCYAVDEKGRYVLAGSAGWEPKNVANSQAWALIDAAVAEALKKVHAGRASPLTYHMARHQMSLGLLAKYVGYSRWRVWFHLKPGPFAKLAPDIVQRYAAVFGITVPELMTIPEKETGK